MSRPTKKITIKDLEIKVLIQKIITILVLQVIIYGIFIWFDPGFLDSLIVYFTLVAIGSSVLIAWVHVHNIMEEYKVQTKQVIDQTDWTPKTGN
nr:hypothetical protein [Candidatus Sigynarchaeota archaeon]